MKVSSAEISCACGGNTDTQDITEAVQAEVTGSGIREGIVTVFVPGSTAAVTTIEYEPNLVQDLKDTAERWAPSGHRYHHGDTWGDDNGASHMRASLIGPSLTVPIRKGKLTLGTWQQIVLVDFDTRPRQRTVLLQIIGQ